MKVIARRLRVSLSSVSAWVGDIVHTLDQQLALERRNPAVNGELVGVRARSALALARRVAWQEEGRLMAARGDPFHAAGCMLFWAEGSKARNTVRFSNSDPAMVAYFADFLRMFFDVPEERFRVDCNLFADHAERQSEIETFWLARLRLPRSCLRKSTVNVYSTYSEKNRTNKLPYGTCRLSAHDTRIVQSLYGAIQAYAGFRRERWLH